jgi:V/A-type H+-transporting ATPase subunit A
MVGTIIRVSGPVIEAKDMLGVKLGEVVRVGNAKLIGEVIRINKDVATIQVYEETSGIMPSEPVFPTGMPLSVELGPGLLGSIYDGIQRPLDVISAKHGAFVPRGVEEPALDRKKKWHFKPVVKNGTKVKEGQIIGTVKETENIEHKIIVPIGLNGTITGLKEGSYTVEDPIAEIDGKELTLMQKWPVKKPRPYVRKLTPDEPLTTGQRIIDFFFPIPKGGTAAIPGPFGSGKCVVGETPILINNELKQIKEIFKYAEKNGTKIVENRDETLIELETPLTIQTFDGKEIRESIATHVYKGYTNKLIEIKTRSGRRIKLTPVHKLLKLDSELRIVETPAERLKEGDFIIAPRKITLNESYKELQANFECRVCDEKVVEQIPRIIEKVVKKQRITKKELAKRLNVPYDTLMGVYLGKNRPSLKLCKKLFRMAKTPLEMRKIKVERQSKSIVIPKYMDEELAELLGYLLADGTIKGKTTIEFYNKNKELRKRAKYLLEKKFGLEAEHYYARTVDAVRVHSRALVRFLAQLGYPLKKKSKHAKVPAMLLSSPESVIKSFLLAYIECDGYIGKNEIEITTASKDMLIGLSYLLQRLGIIYRVSEKTLCRGKYFRISIPAREAVKIAPYFNKEHYYNSTDIIPMNSALFKSLLGNTKPFELEKTGIASAAYYVDQNLTAKTFQRVVSRTNVAKHIKQLADALNYVFCDRIEKVRVINKRTEVYDITVPDTHNFVGGTIPLILHNTVMQHQLAKWADAEIIVYVGCGERGNEMTDVLTEFPKLVDPKTGKPLMERTVLIANTSNMPVAAREASIYTGITIAEYYRDQGFNVALMADSTSRWAEALREVSSRLEEMPGEEGYPAYLGSRVAEFYERAGRVQTFSDTIGSVSVIGAVSPPGGDFSEPVTQSTLRVTKVFWALDANLAKRRHFPAINWLTSYSLYLEQTDSWFAKNVNENWPKVRSKAMALLQKEAELQEIVQIVGPDALPERERLTLMVARMIREDFLQQNAFHEIDSYCPAEKQLAMIELILFFYEETNKLEVIRTKEIEKFESLEHIARLKYLKSKDALNEVPKIKKLIEKEVAKLAEEEHKAFAGGEHQ